MRLQPERRIREKGLNHTEIGRPKVGIMQSSRLEASGSLSNPKRPDFPVCGFMHD